MYSLSLSPPSGDGGGTNWSNTGLIIVFLVLLAAYLYRNYTTIFASEQKEQ